MISVSESTTALGRDSRASTYDVSERNWPGQLAEIV